MKHILIKISLVSILQFFVNVNLFAGGLIPVEGVSPVKNVVVVDQNGQISQDLSEDKTKSLTQTQIDTDVGKQTEMKETSQKIKVEEKDNIKLADNKEVNLGVTEEEKEEVMKISYYLDRDQDNKLVVLPRGSKQGIRDQVILRSYRVIRGVHIPTGTLKVVRVYPSYSVARVIEEGLSDEGLVGRFTSVMAGDEVREYAGTIYRKEQIVENIELRYKDIFEEWDRDSLILNLSSLGKRLIKKKVEELLDKGVNKIMIESYSGNVGSYSSNQVESEQRGNIVKYFIDQEFELDPSRVVVVGFGKSEPKVEGNSRESQETNRRVVIKAM